MYLSLAAAINNHKEVFSFIKNKYCKMFCLLRGEALASLLTGTG
ncbi:hypothetical protein BH09BAC3_BH09BAC3_34140 [soil metagenome]